LLPKLIDRILTCPFENETFHESTALVLPMAVRIPPFPIPCNGLLLN